MSKKSFRKQRNKKIEQSYDIAPPYSPLDPTDTPTRFTYLLTQRNRDPAMYIGIPYDRYKGTKAVGKHQVSPWRNFRSREWNELYDTFKVYDYKLLNDIPLGEKYIVYIHMYLDIKPYFSLDLNKFKSTDKYPMPSRVWDDSSAGLVHWVIDYGTECNQLDGVDNYHMHQILQLLNTDEENITLITGAATRGELGKPLLDKIKYNVATGTELFNFIDWNRDIHQLGADKKISSIVNNTILPYKSLNYNRIPREHRTVIVAHQMHHNYDKAIYSLMAGGTQPENNRWYTWRKYFPEYENEFLKLEQLGDIHCQIKEDDIDLQINLAPDVGWIHAYNCSFQLVTETQPTSLPYPFITEKSLKAFGMLMPFIQSAPYRNIQYLREFGFCTFDKWIDHSYDNEKDDVKRLKMVLAEFDRLYAIPAEQWAEMLVEMLPELLHNLHIVRGPIQQPVEQQLIPIYTKHFETTKLKYVKKRKN